MSRILEYSPAPEEAVVSRILVMVHKAVDESFPDAQKASKQFTKTVFSHEDQDATAMNKAAVEGEDVSASFSGDDDTEEVIAPSQNGHNFISAPKHTSAPEYNSLLDPTRKHLESEPESKIMTREDSGRPSKPDWVARGLIALILAGLLMLVFLWFAKPST